MSTASDGFIHRFVAGTNTAAPPLLLLHGTGGSENDLLTLGREIAPGAALLSPRGKVSEGGMARFFRRFSEGVFDQADLAARTEELAAWIQAVTAENKIDATRLIAFGFSNGANIAASLLLRRPEVLAGAILIRAMVPFVPEKQTRTLEGKSVLLLNGRADPIVPLNQPEELATILRNAGAEVELHWERAGHNLTAEDLIVSTRWMESLQSPAASGLKHSAK